MTRNTLCRKDHHMQRRIADRVRRFAIGLDMRWRMLAQQPEQGAATAEYAVVLVAATGFAAVLVSLLKSDSIKSLLTSIIQTALQVV